MTYLSRPRFVARGLQFSAKTLLVPIIAAAGLSGCQTAPEARIQTVETKVPIAIQPIKPSDVPTPPQPLGPRPATAQQAADAAFAGWCAAVAYIDRAVPLLNVSAGLPPIQAPDYPECKKR